MLSPIFIMGQFLQPLYGFSVAAAGDIVWISQTTDADWWQGTIHSQGIKNSSARTISKVRIKLENAAGDTTGTVGIYSLQNAGGTQTGTSSQAVTLTGATAAWYEFTWASNPTTTAGDFFICLSCGSGNIRVRTSTVSTSYENSSYDYWNDATTHAADMVFEIYTIP